MEGGGVGAAGREETRRKQGNIHRNHIMAYLRTRYGDNPTPGERRL